MAKAVVAALALALVGAVVWFSGRVSAARDQAKQRTAETEQRVARCRAERDAAGKEAVALRGDLAAAQSARQLPVAIDPSVLSFTARAPRSGGGGGSPAFDPRPVIAQNKGRLQVCYERALKRDAALAQRDYRMALRFTVEPSGRVTSVSVRPHLDDDLSACIEQAVKRWQFGAFSGGSQTFEAPVTLSPKGD